MLRVEEQTTWYIPGATLSPNPIAAAGINPLKKSADRTVRTGLVSSIFRAECTNGAPIFSGQTTI